MRKTKFVIANVFEIISPASKRKIKSSDERIMEVFGIEYIFLKGYWGFLCIRNHSLERISLYYIPIYLN